MSIVIVIEILVGILVLGGVVRFVVRDARQRRAADPSDDSALSTPEASVPAEPLAPAPDAESAAPAPDAESDAQLQPSEAADRA